MDFWPDIVLILVIFWAIVHSYMDYKQSKRIDKLEK